MLQDSSKRETRCPSCVGCPHTPPPHPSTRRGSDDRRPTPSWSKTWSGLAGTLRNAPTSGGDHGVRATRLSRAAKPWVKFCVSGDSSGRTPSFPLGSRWTGGRPPRPLPMLVVTLLVTQALSPTPHIPTSNGFIYPPSGLKTTKKKKRKNRKRRLLQSVLHTHVRVPASRTEVSFGL